jgi:predicted lysophospholipase L1 biosynthesis ABC-type transport system permease subunit
VINESMAMRVFGTKQVVGRRFEIVGRNSNQLLEIVGVVQDAHFGSLREAPSPLFFLPFSQARTGRGQMTLEVRVVGDPVQFMAPVRREVQALDPAAPPFAVEALSTQVDASLSQERMVASLSSLFGLLALVLASVGLYGIMGYSVSRRTAELGLRAALGAQPVQVFGLILREAVSLVGVGLLIGFPLALAASTALKGLLFDLSPSDPLTLTGVVGVLLLTGALAAFLPARRAAHADPMVPLRSE